MLFAFVVLGLVVCDIAIFVLKRDVKLQLTGVRFSFFNSMPRDWPWRTSPKWRFVL